jgi:hypothetical protein
MSVRDTNHRQSRDWFDRMTVSIPFAPSRTGLGIALAGSAVIGALILTSLAGQLLLFGYSREVVFARLALCLFAGLAAIAQGLVAYGLLLRNTTVIVVGAVVCILAFIAAIPVSIIGLSILSGVR